jgi:hypothetical protein
MDEGFIAFHLIERAAGGKEIEAESQISGIGGLSLSIQQSRANRAGGLA